MASAAFLSICCIANETDIDSTVLQNQQLIGHVVNIVSITFCLISLLSTLYLIWPREEGTRAELFRNTSRILVGPNLNGIIKCIVTANILGVLGIFVRSCTWLADKYPSVTAESLNITHVVCFVTTIWVQYFFTCNYMWHIIYAMEALMVSNNKEMSLSLKYFLGWIFPVILTICGCVATYHPGLDKCFHITLTNELITYIVFLMPVVLVFVFNPIIFYKAAKAAKRALIWHYGRYTSNERKLVDAIHVKFLLIMTAFVACWLPNLLSAVLLLTRANKNDKDASLALWVLMVVLNPLQAVLGALVYWGLPSNAVCRMNIFTAKESLSESDRSSVINRSTKSTRSTSGSESEPLISFKRKDTR